MKYTLLQMTQNILSGIDGDEVNSITDSTESLQVATILETTYWDILSRAELPKNYTFFTLDASGDADVPVVMYLPDDKLTIEWVRYNNATSDDPSPNFVDVMWVPLNDFLQRMYSNNSEEDTVDEIDFVVPAGDTVKLLCRNDQFPKYYTTFDDNTLIFDAYDSDVDTTLQESKTMCYGEKLPTWSMTDSFVPDLPPKQFTLLYNEAKDLAWAELKQSQNAKATQRARRGWISIQKNKRNVNNPRSELERLPDYSRHSGR